MKTDQREMHRKLRTLGHTDENGSVVKTCQYFGIGRLTFYTFIDGGNCTLGTVNQGS